MRPLSPRSETRLRPSFLRTTPARKPRTECCCHPVAVTIAAIVAPAGVCSMATIRACLLSARAALFGDAGADRAPDLGFPVFRVGKREAAFRFDLGLVMGSSEGQCDAIRRTTSAPPEQNTRQGWTPKRRLSARVGDTTAPVP